MVLNKIPNGRRFSPLTIALLVALIVYSLILLKRIRKQQQISSHSLSRRKKSTNNNILDDSSNTFSNLINKLPLKFNEPNLEDTIGLYIITPTYPRPEQLPELTRLSQTLMHVKNIIWIVSEDAKSPTFQVLELLERLKPHLPSVYLLAPMPDVYRKTKDEYHLPKGVSNRNKALHWIFRHAVDKAVVYFADDDNTYDLRLFHEIRKTNTVAMFPVGLVSGSPVSTPIVENEAYAGFYIGWDGNRKFPLDMAGFAFSVEHYRKVSSSKPLLMPYVRGYEEDGFLKKLNISRQTLEILTPDKILVWHTRTSKMVFKPFRRISKADYMNTNLGPLSEYWCLFMGPYKCRNNSTQVIEANYKKKVNNDESGFRII